MPEPGQPDRIPPAAELYAGRGVALLTQHGKERVIAPVLQAALGCRVERVTGYDTDRVGTFTRDVPRARSQLEAARKKARIGMDMSGLPVGLVSEGSFVIFPLFFVFQRDSESRPASHDPRVLMEGPHGLLARARRRHGLVAVAHGQRPGNILGRNA